jgi:hypothetical protein
MQRRTFGQRGAPQTNPSVMTTVAQESPPLPSLDREASPAAPAGPTVEQEIEGWNAARKQHRRSVREPWRTVSIVAGLAFVATSWLVPASVANVAEIALGVLSAGSLYAGWRARKAKPE